MTGARARQPEGAGEVVVPTVSEVVRPWVAVFEGMTWPLLRWQLLVAADDYGISPGVRARLAELPEAPYRDLAEFGRRFVDRAPSTGSP